MPASSATTPMTATMTAQEHSERATASAQLADGPRFSPAAHVLATLQSESAAGFRLTPAARLLAVVLALKSRSTASGAWVSWRGRDSLARICGLDRRTVTAARRLLGDAGIFAFHRAGPGDEVTTPSGKTYKVKANLLIAELVMDPKAFRIARDRSRNEQLQEERQVNREDELQVQKLLITNQIDRDEYDARLRRLRWHFRRARRQKKGNPITQGQQLRTEHRNAGEVAKVIDLPDLEEIRSPVAGDRLARRH